MQTTADSLDAKQRTRGWSSEVLETTASDLECEHESREIQAWTKEQAQHWRNTQGSDQSVLMLLLAQLVVVLVFAVASAYWGLSAAKSALYGGLSVSVPAWLMAFRLGYLSKSPTVKSLDQTWAIKFLVWESLKILLSIVMLVFAPKVLGEVNWLVLVLAVVLSIKSYWLMLIWWRWRGYKKTTPSRQNN